MEQPQRGRSGSVFHQEEMNRLHNAQQKAIRFVHDVLEHTEEQLGKPSVTNNRSIYDPEQVMAFTANSSDFRSKFRGSSMQDLVSTEKEVNVHTLNVVERGTEICNILMNDSSPEYNDITMNYELRGFSSGDGAEGIEEAVKGIRATVCNSYSLLRSIMMSFPQNVEGSYDSFLDYKSLLREFRSILSLTFAVDEQIANFREEIDRARLKIGHHASEMKEMETQLKILEDDLATVKTAFSSGDVTHMMRAHAILKGSSTVNDLSEEPHLRSVASQVGLTKDVWRVLHETKKTVDSAPPPNTATFLVFIQLEDTGILKQKAKETVTASLAAAGSTIDSVAGSYGMNRCNYNTVAEGKKGFPSEGFVYFSTQFLDAITFALEVQCQLLTAEWPKQLQLNKQYSTVYSNINKGKPLWNGLRARIAVHCGEVLVDPISATGDATIRYKGNVIERTAKLLNQSKAGEVVLTEEARDILQLAQQRAQLPNSKKYELLHNFVDARRKWRPEVGHKVSVDEMCILWPTDLKERETDDVDEVAFTLVDFHRKVEGDGGVEALNAAIKSEKAIVVETLSNSGTFNGDQMKSGGEKALSTSPKVNANGGSEKPTPVITPLPAPATEDMKKSSSTLVKLESINTATTSESQNKPLTADNSHNKHNGIQITSTVLLPPAGLVARGVDPRVTDLEKKLAQAESILKRTQQVHDQKMDKLAKQIKVVRKQGLAVRSKYERFVMGFLDVDAMGEIPSMTLPTEESSKGSATASTTEKSENGGAKKTHRSGSTAAHPPRTIRRKSTTTKDTTNALDAAKKELEMLQNAPVSVETQTDDVIIVTDTGLTLTGQQQQQKSSQSTPTAPPPPQVTVVLDAKRRIITQSTPTTTTTNTVKRPSSSVSNNTEPQEKSEIPAKTVNTQHHQSTHLPGTASTTPGNPSMNKRTSSAHHQSTSNKHSEESTPTQATTAQSTSIPANKLTTTPASTNTVSDTINSTTPSTSIPVNTPATTPTSTNTTTTASNPASFASSTSIPANTPTSPIGTNTNTIDTVTSNPAVAGKAENPINQSKPSTNSVTATPPPTIAPSTTSSGYNKGGPVDQTSGITNSKISTNKTINEGGGEVPQIVVKSAEPVPQTTPSHASLVPNESRLHEPKRKSVSDDKSQSSQEGGSEEHELFDVPMTFHVALSPRVDSSDDVFIRGPSDSEALVEYKLLRNLYTAVRYLFLDPHRTEEECYELYFASNGGLQDPTKSFLVEMKEIIKNVQEERSSESGTGIPNHQALVSSATGYAALVFTSIVQYVISRRRSVDLGRSPRPSSSKSLNIKAQALPMEERMKLLKEKWAQRKQQQAQQRAMTSMAIIHTTEEPSPSEYQMIQQGNTSLPVQQQHPQPVLVNNSNIVGGPVSRGGVGIQSGVKPRGSLTSAQPLGVGIGGRPISRGSLGGTPISQGLTPMTTLPQMSIGPSSLKGRRSSKVGQF